MMIKKFLTFPALILLAFCSALNYSIFVFPNSFAPAGMDGIFTMIQDVTKISMGTLSFLANIPLLISAFFFLNREFAIKTSVYVLSFSLSVLILNYLDISRFCYHTSTGTSIILAPVSAGFIRGILYHLTLKLNGSSGGVDIVAALVKRKRPHLNLMNLIFGLNLVVALSSYFVYGMKMEPVICSILYSLITSSISNKISSTNAETIKLEIISPNAEQLSLDITSKLQIPATMVDVQGAYSGNQSKMLLCVTKKELVPQVEALIREYPDCVVFKSIVNDSLAE